ncbi:AMP-binding protein, partial [Thiolapillus sp.]|uniref:AMP-binding protein n=5 Tax=Thiolapillus sp. TaxID=2017437 RepID=UPI003AF9B2F0
MSKVIAALRHHAAHRPDEAALLGDALRLTWGELLAEVNELADRLRDGQVLGVYLPNGPHWVIADLAALAAGITCLPVPLFFSPDQIRHALRDAGVDRIICQRASLFDEGLPTAREETLIVAGKLLSYLQLEDVKDSLFLNRAKITYTSGTTGNPKGVPLSLQQMEGVAISLKEAAAGSTDDKALVLLPLSTLLENIGSVYVPILAGATMLVPDADSLGFSGSSQVDARTLGKKLQQLQPTTAILVPQLLKLFLGLAATQMLPSSFRFIAVGGAPVSAAQLAQAQALGLPVYQGYGLSEASSVVAMNGPDDNRPGSVGKLLPHCGVRVAHDGEILLSGTGFTGYVQEPVGLSAVWYATGDLGYVDKDDYLYIDGRKREVIISSFGRNVSPEWVESELLTESGIVQAAVFGNSRPFVSAVIIAAPSADMKSIRQAVTRVNDRLPDYARVGAFVLAEQPFQAETGELTANG